MVAALAASGAFLVFRARANTSGTTATPGYLWNWGVNGSSELGRASSETCGTLACSTAAAQVNSLASLQTIAAGSDHSLVVTLSGAVYAWGLDADGQVGMPTTDPCTCIKVPTQVNGLPANAADVAGGGAHSLALTSTGALYAWGRNADGQLGNGTTTSSTTPVQVTGLPGNIIGIAAGSCDSLALTADGLVYAWGCNGSGQLGTGNTTGSTTPVQVSGLIGVTAIATKSATSLALTSSGALYAWGDNTYGQLGNGTTTNSSTPVQVGISASVTAISAGGFHNLALTTTSAVYAWGRNDYGQLGATTTQTCGSYACSTTPVAVSGLPTGVTKIASGASHNLALTSSNTVYTWGANTLGQLDIGSSDSSPHPTPAQANTLTGVPAIAAGGDFNLTIVDPVASVNTTFINFGDQPVGTTSADQDVTLTNVGIVPLTITNAAVGGPNPGDFTLAYGVCPSAAPPLAVIAPGGSCTLNISFAPTNAGTRTATLTVTSDAINGPLNGTVTGNGTSPTTGFSPSSLTFPSQAIGTSSAPQTLTVSNSGTATLTITAIAISGANASDFSFTAPALPLSITVGSSATLSVSFSPASGPAGTQTGSLDLTDNDYLHPHSVPLSGTALSPATGFSPSSLTFAGQYEGTSSALQIVTVSNSGTATLTVTRVSISGVNAGDFSFNAPTMPFSIAPGSSAPISVAFSPASGPAGARSGSLDLTDNDYLHPQSVPLSGTALLPADLSVGLTASPNPVKHGANLTYTITVANGGPGASSNVVMSDTLPSGTVFASVATTLGACSAPAVGGTGTVTCTASSLGNGASYTVTLVVTVQAGGGATLSDTTSVSASTLDSNSANNTATVTTSVYGKH
jgi:uncharacterized repeat protein (TIGR01451 family)